MSTYSRLGHSLSDTAEATGPRRTPCGRGAERRPSRTARSSWRRRAGSATTSISVILPSVIVKPSTRNSRPRGAITSPTAPFTSAGWVNLARSEEASTPLATAWAPRSRTDPGRKRRRPRHVRLFRVQAGRAAHRGGLRTAVDYPARHPISRLDADMARHMAKMPVYNQADSHG